MMPLLLVVSVLHGFPAHAADAGVDARVAAIRALSERIEAGVNAKVWTTAKFVPKGQSTQGSDANAWCNGRQLQKATVSWMGESGKADEIFLYQDGALAFAFRDEVMYTASFSGEGTHRKTRYYWDGTTLVRIVAPDGSTIDRPTGPITDEARALRDDAMTYAKATTCPSP